MALRCIDCTKIDLQDQNKWGEYYCFETRSYVRGDSYTCRWFDQRDLGGCYLTTAFCHILGYKDDCYELETMRKLRDNYISKQSYGKKLINDYYAEAPAIVKKINASENREEILEEMYAKITNIAKMVDAENYDEAVINYMMLFHDSSKI